VSALSLNSEPSLRASEGASKRADGTVFPTIINFAVLGGRANRRRRSDSPARRRRRHPRRHRFNSPAISPIMSTIRQNRARRKRRPPAPPLFPARVPVRGENANNSRRHLRPLPPESEEKARKQTYRAPEGFCIMRHSRNDVRVDVIQTYRCSRGARIFLRYFSTTLIRHGTSGGWWWRGRDTPGGRDRAAVDAAGADVEFQPDPARHPL